MYYRKTLFGLQLLNIKKRNFLMIGLKFEIDANEIVAWYEDKRIGFIQFEEIEINGSEYLNCTHASVHIDFQGRRVGTQLFKKLIDMMPIGINGICISEEYLKESPYINNIFKKFANSYTDNSYHIYAPFKA